MQSGLTKPGPSRELLAKDIMSTPVISVEPDTPVTKVAALLSSQRISGVPVIKNGQLIGVVNEMDLLHRHEIGTEDSSASNRGGPGCSVEITRLRIT